METMKFRVKTIIILITLLCTLPLHAWKIFPLVSYSSSSGVLMGGIVNNNMTPPFKPFGFSSIAYCYTNGSISAEPKILFPAGGGLVTLNANYYVKKKDKFFGWGNGGNNELYEYFYAEIQDISASYHFSPLSGLVMTGGLLCRHSTAYNRSDEQLWNQSPTDEYTSQWTAGPYIEGNWSLPIMINGYLSAGYDIQLGNDISYSSAECAMSVFTPIGSSTTPAFRMKVERHMGTSSTPFSFLPSLGGNNGLRGYNDGRFGGNWALLSNLELRQKIISFQIDENNTMDFSLVLFGDAGQVADHLNECGWNRFHLDGGLGARISLPGGGTLRADFAVSPEGLGIQMGLGELF
jgi:hypothetical protein